MMSITESDDMTLTNGMDINEMAATYHFIYSYGAQQQLAHTCVMLIEKVAFCFNCEHSTRVFFFLYCTFRWARKFQHMNFP